MNWHIVRYSDALAVPKGIRKLLEEAPIEDGLQARDLYQAVRSTWTALDEIALHAQNVLESSAGHLLIENVAFAAESPKLRDAALVCLCAAIGTVMGHDARGQSLVWPITPRVAAGNSVSTFSEHDREAEFHTDSQYRQVPERYFALLTIHPARDGGGTTSILPGDAILDALSSSPQGREDAETLGQALFPFRVPTIFTSRQRLEEAEVIRVPVLADEPLIRYRRDTLLAGLAHERPHSGVSDLRKLIDRLHHLISRCGAATERRLERGDLLLINNHQLLHGRSAFSDAQRLLLRVRFTRV
jgi:alpha-ketoglutarate-dependent taurine dioxygenase